jgi:imidazolonepropionase-like amidohydrolase/ABC-type multidrug transport system permease subunit
MKVFWAHTLINLKLTARDRMVLFFNYAFPLLFFFFFGQIMHAEQGGTAVYVVSMVLTMGVLGNGFFGAGIRAAMDREQNILRRFKVAPITPVPLLLASLATGLINYLPAVVVILGLAHGMWGMALPPHLAGFFIFIAISILAFRAIGLIIASSVNSMQEGQVLVQVLYVPMLLLSLMPLSELPTWGQVASQFVPAGYLQMGMQGILIRSEGLTENASALGALVLTAVLGTFIATKLFRWDKDEKVRPAAKLWILAVLTPFFVLGAYQTHTREALLKAKVLERNLLREQNVLVRNARIFLGDGKVIEYGSVLIKRGKIQQVFEGSAPDVKDLKAEAIEGAGKTVVPGLIDLHVHLAASGGFSSSPPDTDQQKAPLRELGAYLYSGVTSVRSVGDPLDAILQTRATISSGERLGAELYSCGPLFTVAGGHGTEYFKNLPAVIRKQAEAQTVRTPTTPEEARQQVRELKTRGVDCIKAILEAGTGEIPFNRMDVKILTAIADEARAQSLVLAVHTGDSRDVADAVSAGANSIEHGSFRDTIPDDVFVRMRSQNVFYDPTLAVAEAQADIAEGSLEPLERPLVQQVIPFALIQSTKHFLESADGKKMSAALRAHGVNLDQGRRNLLRAYQLGVPLATGSDSGNPLVFHGPAIHRELQLWVSAGVPPSVALQAATYNSARLLGSRELKGMVKPGYEANLIIVDGNPLKDIRQTENLSQIILRGERIHRAGLFEQE